MNIWRGCTYRVEPPSDRNTLHHSLLFKATSIVHHELGPLTYRRLISMNLNLHPGHHGEHPCKPLDIAFDWFPSGLLDLP